LVISELPVKFRKILRQYQNSAKKGKFRRNRLEIPWPAENCGP